MRDWDPTDILTGIYIRQTLPDVDGVWWHEDYDPANLSAPRGGIVHPLDRYALVR